ncbi:DUF4173 domain-containing protein [Bacillus sp. DTU_2020_1000418_1_SI_GHA_SEK_038]|uniref:DUF4153 domain-containing protein n=1 Tax=Bacillus sp. DTU_2020_1000418_1_SI_GHA_SEK_038 TaxID=3077585 RepID=UPI0028E358C2|nr:DUF4173 domain-containing protein [Bacillus sp. DTU_2020_1000418_1_SI_GHA_SEK_038]WNS74940.1 DUF4173 domain-containing protein [Bacillus sp. DTU_2020_1000418_1_SI_GHA_SEK_038]
MEIKIERIDWIFFFLCFLMGIMAEEAFFRYQIGISYFLFIAVFYALFFWRFRTFSFSHQRFGYLILIVIWLLAASYYLYDTALFYALNILLIPALVIFHLALITSPKKIEWSSIYFISYTLLRLIDGIRYSALFTKYTVNLTRRGSTEKQNDIWKKVLIGVAISFPFLFVILNLLMSADTQFERLLSSIPGLFNINGEYVFRLVIILIYTFSFFGFLQVLFRKNIHIIQKEGLFKPFGVDGIIALTVLLLLDVVYVIFVAVQFKYFFSGTLDEGFTYAEYARRGFFELLFVTLINLTVITGVINFTKKIQGMLKKTINSALTILILSSGVLLTSAFMRLTMYEDAYGFTLTRVLAHSFMIFLMVIFAYTLVKIWIERLSLIRFYFIAALIYYAGINIANIDRIVVDQNMARFDTTGKIDIQYLNSLSSTGIMGLIELYERNPDVQGLETLLMQRKEEREHVKSRSWQSHNLARDSAYEMLGELDF